MPWERSGKMVVLRQLLRLWKEGGHRVLLFAQTRQVSEGSRAAPFFTVHLCRLHLFDPLTSTCLLFYWYALANS